MVRAAQNIEELTPGHLPVPEEFHRPGVVALRVSGDCMAPEVPHGAYVLVDPNDTALEEGGLYVLEAPGGRFVKRAVRRGEEWRFEPDNPGHPGFALEEVRVLGRIYGVVLTRWFGGGAQ